MKVLLDENLPEQLKDDLPGHEVFSIREIGWKGKKNGELMLLLEKEKFDVLLTSDKNLQHQQNLKKYSISILLLNVKQNTYPVIQKLIPQILKLLSTDLRQGLTVIE